MAKIKNVVQDVSTQRALSTAEYKVVSSLLGVCLLHHKVQASQLMYCVDLCVVEVMYVCIVNSIKNVFIATYI